MSDVKKSAGFPENPDSDFEGLNRTWHLAKDSHQVAVAEFEYSLLRAFEAFGHWQSECLAAVSGLTVSGSDNAILHVIRMKDRPKGIKEIARLTNRDDLPNLQYSIRKLQQEKLIEKTGSSAKRKGVTYQVTDLGRQVTEQYAELRAKLLINFTKSVGNLENDLTHTSLTLDLMAGIYEQAARIAATHRS